MNQNFSIESVVESRREDPNNKSKGKKPKPARKVRFYRNVVYKRPLDLWLVKNAVDQIS